MSAPTIDDITAAARRSTQTMVRPSRAFWGELLRAFMHPAMFAAAVFDDMTEAELRALLVETAVHEFGSEEEAARARWAKVFGLEVQP